MHDHDDEDDNDNDHDQVRRRPMLGLSHRLRRHPIPMVCQFEHSLVVSWAVPAAVLAPFVPPGLALDTYDDQWGFIAVAAVQTRRLRPEWVPSWCGRDYALTGYRIFVRHRGPDGRLRRGLHILRSDTDKRTMQLGGNLLTHYRYRRSRVGISAAEDRLAVEVHTRDGEADLHLVAHLDDEPAPLPPSSPFRSAGDARRYAGPLAWTFDHEPETSSIIMIHGHRTDWRPQPVQVDVKTCSFLDAEPFGCADVRLANAFHVSGVDYRWDRGDRVPLAPMETDR